MTETKASGRCPSSPERLETSHRSSNLKQVCRCVYVCVCVCVLDSRFNKGRGQRVYFKLPPSWTDFYLAVQIPNMGEWQTERNKASVVVLGMLLD